MADALQGEGNGDGDVGAREGEGERIDLDVPFDATPASVPGRLDAWLAAALGAHDPPLSRSRIKALIERGRVTLDGTPVRDAKRKLRGGEAVRIVVPPPEPALPEPEAIPLDILHEDDELIVLVKPVGMVVHPGAGVRSGTLVNALLHHARGSLSGIGGVARPGIVHRLDRDTSGVMVVAKTDAAHRALSTQFADHGRTGPLERSTPKRRALGCGSNAPAGNRGLGSTSSKSRSAFTLPRKLQSIGQGRSSPGSRRWLDSSTRCCSWPVASVRVQRV